MIMNTDIDNGSDINVVLLPYTDRALNACELQASQADSKVLLLDIKILGPLLLITDIENRTTLR